MLPTQNWIFRLLPLVPLCPHKSIPLFHQRSFLWPVKKLTVLVITICCYTSSWHRKIINGGFPRYIRTCFHWRRCTSDFPPFSLWRHTLVFVLHVDSKIPACRFVTLPISTPFLNHKTSSEVRKIVPAYVFCANLFK